MTDVREHLAFPLRMGADGYLVVVDQDSDPEIAGCIAVNLLWPLGTRELDPEFGVDDPTFSTGGADLQSIREALAHGEPRIGDETLQDDQQLGQLVAAVTVGWDDATQGAQP